MAGGACTTSPYSIYIIFDVFKIHYFCAVSKINVLRLSSASGMFLAAFLVKNTVNLLLIDLTA